MKKSYIAAAVVALGLAISSLASHASAESKPKPGVVDARSATVTGTVDSIDYNSRIVTLKLADGQLTSMQVGPQAVRFNEVKQGDVVKITYLESVAVMVSDPHDTVASTEATGTVIVRNKGSKPSGTAVDTQIVTATVVKINARRRTAVLKGPDGNEFPIDVAPDVKHLENVKKGDQVIVKYTRSLAIDVSKPN